MDLDELVSVQDAASRLRVTPDAVRKRIAAGSLPAQRLGRQWWLDARSIDRLARASAKSGRPLSPEVAWSVLLLASGDEESASAVLRDRRYRSRVRTWLREHSLAEDASHLRARATCEEFDAHPSELRRIRDHGDVLATGISAGNLIGLVRGDSAVEVYAPFGRRAQMVDEHVLQPGPGPIRIRWLPDAIWPLLKRHHSERAPRAAVLVDLVEHDDPRARREAARALER